MVGHRNMEEPRSVELAVEALVEGWTLHFGWNRLSERLKEEVVQAGRLMLALCPPSVALSPLYSKMIKVKL